MLEHIEMFMEHLDVESSKNIMRTGSFVRILKNLFYNVLPAAPFLHILLCSFQTLLRISVPCRVWEPRQSLCLAARLHELDRGRAGVLPF